MSGHSKWKNIMHKKEKTDAQRAKVFTKIGKEMAIAVKAGGPDPVSNAKLRDLIAKAKANNVPNDNIERVIKKASGADAVAYEELVYEGYGPCGIAVIVETLTDNRNRTAGEMRHYFDKYGGNMGQAGSVMFMFNRQGNIVIEKDGVDEDALLETALEAGAIDMVTEEEEVFEVRTEPNDVGTVNDALAAAGYVAISAEAEYLPTTYTRLDNPDDIKNMGKMLEMFEDNDDVQNVWHNWENEEDYE